MEIWDAYNSDGTKAGFDLKRDEPVPRGFYHMVAEIVVRHEDGSHLLMQRDFKKNVYPGVFEASAGGSVIKGENPLEAAYRELREETGIEAEDLTPIYRVVSGDGIYCGYLCITDCPKDSVTLQEGETISYLWLDKADFIRFINSEKYIAKHKEVLEKYYLNTPE